MAFTLAAAAGIAEPHCRVKHRYTVVDARAAIATLVRDGRHQPERGPLVIYWCKYHGTWHVGHERRTGMQEIVIEIAGDKVRIEGKGFVGTECTALTADLERELGDVERRDMKPEARQARAATHKIGA